MAKKISMLALFVIFSTMAFSQIKLHGNGLAKEVKFYADGNVKVEGYFKNGVKNGKWIHYYAEGSVESIRYYDSKGAPNGKWTYYYKDGQKWNTVNYNKGELNGQWTYWYQNGNKWHQLSYSEGEVRGRWTFWEEDGSLNGSGRYREDTARKG